MKFRKNIDLVIAAKAETNGKRHLFEISKKFRSITYYDGYNRDQEDDILRNVDLGVICPLWEDNLPQVAIEMHCRNIPLLTSDAGGASELHGKCKEFMFKSGNVDDFIDKLINIYHYNVDYDSYCLNRLRPVSMQEHLQSLINIYKTC